RGTALARTPHAVAQLADDAARPEPILLAGPRPDQLLEALRAQRLGAASAQGHGRLVEADLGVMGNEVVERPDAEPVQSHAAAGEGCTLRLAMLLGAIGED